MHARLHTHTHTHADAHTHTNTHCQPDTTTCTAYTNHKHIRTHTHIHAHTHTPTHALTNTHIHGTHKHTQTHTCKHARTHTHKQTHTRMQTRTHAHTHTHTHAPPHPHKFLLFQTAQFHVTRGGQEVVRFSGPDWSDTRVSSDACWPCSRSAFDEQKQRSFMTGTLLMCILGPQDTPLLCWLGTRWKQFALAPGRQVPCSSFLQHLFFIYLIFIF